MLEDEVEVELSVLRDFFSSAMAGVDDLGEVVRRDVGRHADGDAGRLPLTMRLGTRAGRTVGSRVDSS